MSDIPQSDVSRPSKLPTANLLPHGAAPLAIEQTSAEYLEAVEEEWNKRVDVEIETLADGMVDLVNLASVSFHEKSLCRLDLRTRGQINNKDKFKIAQETFQAQFRAESMVLFFFLMPARHEFRSFDADKGGQLPALNCPFYETATAPIR